MTVVLRELEQLAREKFSVDTLHPFQVDVITRLLGGASLLAVVATGAGKSLCYQLPSLLWDEGVLVVSPLVALMHHQAERLAARGIRAEALTSQWDRGRQSAILDAWQSGELRLLYTAPERLSHAGLREALRRRAPRLLVVDEAHCISEWGYDFRPEYRRIRALREQIGPVAVLALTATATARVKADIRWHLTRAGEPFAVVEGPIDRPNLFLSVHLEADVQRQRERVAALTESAAGGVIIYATSRRQAEEWARYLKRSQPKGVAHYHAGLEPGQRRLVEREFASGRLRVVAATTAFGMGIDRSDIRRVIHVGVPDSLDAYYQEIGRAGRDGLPAEAAMVVQPVEIYRRDQWIRDQSPDREWIDIVVGRVGRQPLGRPVWWEIADEDVRTPVALSLLEDRGTIERHLDARGVKVLRLTQDMQREADALDHRLTQLWQQRRRLFDAMVGYIEASSCRREILLGYYGNTRTPSAHCCDRCQTGASIPGPVLRPDGVVVDALRLWRLNTARKLGVAPYLVLSDRDLMGLAILRPTRLETLARARGIGARRLARFGAELISLFQSFGPPASEAVDPASPRDRALWHFQAGTPFSRVVEEVGRSSSTVRAYFIDWVKSASRTEWMPYLAQWFSLREYRQMQIVMNQLGTERIRPLYDAAHGRFSFEQWDVARAVYARIGTVEDDTLW